MSPWSWYNSYAAVFVVWDSYGPGHMWYANVNHAEGVVRQ